MIVDSLDLEGMNDIDRMLESSINIANIVRGNNVEIKVPHENSGKGDGDKNVPPIMRELIGALAIEDGVEKAAQEFGVANSSASNYSNGLKHRTLDDKLASAMDEVRNSKVGRLADKKLDAEDKAVDLLMKGFGLVEEELGNKNLKSAERAVRVANGLASISQKMRKEEKQGDIYDNRRLVIVAPPRIHIDSYEQVDV